MTFLTNNKFTLLAISLFVIIAILNTLSLSEILIAIAIIALPMVVSRKDFNKAIIDTLLDIAKSKREQRLIKESHTEENKNKKDEVA